MASKGTETVTDKYEDTYNTPCPGYLRPWEHTRAGTSGCYSKGWQSCRVSFHENYDVARIKAAEGNWGEVPGFYYCPAGAHQTIDSLVGLLSEVEKAAGCSDAGLTISPGVKGSLFVAPGEWWSDPIRLTLLSILLRSAGDNIEQTIKNHNYLKQTERAVRHFLAGHTFYKSGTYDGWVYAFGPSRAGNEDPGVFLDGKPAPLEEVGVSQHPGWTRRQWRLAKK